MRKAFCVLVITLLLLQGCTLWCRNDCRKIEYLPSSCCQSPFSPAQSPCPKVKVPGFFRSNLNCYEHLQRLSALRQRGIGVIIFGDRIRLVLPTDALFTRDSIEPCVQMSFNECQLPILAEIGDILKTIPCVPIIISGHTDNVGPRPEKYRRSKEMAKLVAAHMWAQGVPYERMRVLGRADCDPISSDHSVFGSSDNRRVEIRLDFSGNDLYNCRYNNTY